MSEWEIDENRELEYLQVNMDTKIWYDTQAELIKSLPGRCMTRMVQVDTYCFIQAAGLAYFEESTVRRAYSILSQGGVVDDEQL